MAFRFHVVENMLNFPVWADYEGRSGDSFYDFSIHILVFDHAKRFRDRLVRISQQRVRQVVLILKFLLLFGAVCGNAEYNRSSLLNLFVCVAEPARFYRSAWSIGLGVEEQDNCFAGKIF
jgi:hypothetical protein